MKVLVVGQGGREHAIVRALHLTAPEVQIHAVPGNAGMAKEAVCHSLNWKDSESLVQFCLRTEIDFVVIGPEDPLVAGLADKLRERGILVFGPDSEAARLEGSKIFAKEFLRSANIPTARAEVVQSVNETMKAAEKYAPPYVLKADGLCAGKGVVLCSTLEDLRRSAEDYFEKKTLGEAGARALLEEFMPGWELSFLFLTNGKSWQALPVAQDHKRLGDGNLGPNTGGMGAICPLSLETDLRRRIETEIIEPTVRAFSERRMVYRGVVFIGLMITPSGPSVIEYNVRFGDPEAQVILPLLEGSWSQVFKEIAEGKMPALQWKNLHSCCVVMAAPGYPEAPQKGVIIEGDPLYEGTSGYFLHAGTSRDGSGRWVTNGGRVLGAVGIGSSKEEAIRQAYLQSSKVRWQGQRLRGDIGQASPN
jgi:phosphoribosylamine--glycine ligase